MDDEGEPLSLPLEDNIDLHPFKPSEIVDVVREYLTAAHAAGFSEVRLIHGRGKGFQRARVHSLLASLSFVLEARDAPPERGGWGATIVRLAPVPDR